MSVFFYNEVFVRMVTENIESGYPVNVISEEYIDTILATGYSHQGRILKGIPFLDGDDEKNSAMSFQQLKTFPEWYVKDADLLLIKAYPKIDSVADKCREALQKGCALLSNKKTSV